MSEMRVVPLDFVGSMPLIRPADDKLHALAIDFVKENFAEPLPNLTHYRRVWVAVEFQGEEMLRVTGIAGWQLRPDISLFRTAGETSKQSFAGLYSYLRDYFVENGWRGADVLVEYGADAPPELLCPNLEETLRTVGAKPSQRMTVRVK